jgi:ribonuclease M5
MYQIKEAIIVEGVYDKIKLSRFIDGIIFQTHGFSIFSNPDGMKTIEKLAQRTGIVILTDSDSAGFKIRHFIKQSLPADQVKHAYIPDVHGKEKRKAKPGKEGLLGVEGISEEVILDALKKAGCTIDGSKSAPKAGRKITKATLYQDGFSGGEKSAGLRRAMAKELGLPSKISANMLLDVLNRLVSLEEYHEIVQVIKEKEETCG